MVELPTLHPSQVAAFEVVDAHRFVAMRCGRRWGKTDFCKVIAGDGALKGETWGWFAPDYKRLSEAYNEMASMLSPVKQASSKIDGVFRVMGGGRIDWWTLEDEHAGRSRKYHGVIIDEGAFTKPTMIGVWEKAIKPTLLDYGGRAIVASNTNGIAPENFLYAICHEPKFGFVDFHATSFDNPYLPKDELAKLQADNHPLVFQQEYLAEFVDWSGEAFFALPKLLCDDQPIELPKRCDGVFSVVDTATKTGTDNDGTAVTHFAVTLHGNPPNPLAILDWDIAQIEGSLLEGWLPSVFATGQGLAATCGARRGYIGCFIEDKSSGMVLLQQGKRRGWPVHEIDSKLTSVGKDERALSVSGYVYRDRVKITRPAYDKVTNYKGTTRNHLLGQVTGFRVGDKDAAKRADDLLDTFTYGVAIALGNSEGF